ncbi:MAG: serine hydrolase [bacterium]|nr:serine hydrolase [bacterium]
MKQFFLIVFGGALAVSFGVGVAYGGAVGWRYLEPKLASISSSIALPAASVVAHDGTFISGMKRAIKYTASEEEAFIESAVLSLPAAADKRVSASAYLVKNLTLGDVPTEHNPDQLFPIASLTKLITAVIVRQQFNVEERIVMTQPALATYGNSAYFKVGETLKVSDLMYPLLMVSSNDAAEAFARAHGRKQFIDDMNDWVQSIGAYRTYFADPSGLSPLNVSTANDIALILDWIRLNDPEIIKITSLKSKTVRSHTWINPTHYLSWSYYIGGKNGYTSEANRTSAGLFKLGKNKNIYAVVVLGSDNRDADVLKLMAKVRD